MEYQELVSFTKKLSRAFFVDNEFKEYAHLDRALPIGYDQTISQPSLVLKMTSFLEPEKDSKVLEIGTGSGYQTVLLAEFSKMVYTIERIEQLSKKAKERLDKLGYKNVFYCIGDGSAGWNQNAPYDRIMVTAAAEEVPPELVSQLKEGGRMIIPVGSRNIQDLFLFTKARDGQIRAETLGKVIFVEFKGKYGWKHD